VQHVDEQMDEGDDQPVDLAVGRQPALLDVLELLENQAERVVVTDVEDFLLVAEVVVEIPRRHIERAGDLIDAGAVISAPPEDRRRRAQDFDPLPFATGARSGHHAGA
jgi:hypothetical protein